jgi:hypothetical protein
MAQVLVGGISFVDCVRQSKDGLNDVPMSTMMGDSVEKQMCDILVQQVEKLTLNTKGFHLERSCHKVTLAVTLASF